MISLPRPDTINFDWIGKILSPFQGLIFFEQLAQGVALGYHLSGRRPLDCASFGAVQQFFNDSSIPLGYGNPGRFAGGS